MLRDLSLRNAENFLEMTDAKRTTCKQMDYPQSRGVAETLINLNQFHGRNMAFSIIFVNHYIHNHEYYSANTNLLRAENTRRTTFEMSDSTQEPQPLFMNPVSRAEFDSASSAIWGGSDFTWCGCPARKSSRFPTPGTSRTSRSRTLTSKPSRLSRAGARDRHAQAMNPSQPFASWRAGVEPRPPVCRAAADGRELVPAPQARRSRPHCALTRTALAGSGEPSPSIT